MKKTLLLAQFLLIAFCLSAQEYTYQKDEVKVTLTEVLNMSDDKDDWMVSLQNLEMPLLWPFSWSVKIH